MGCHQSKVEEQVEAPVAAPETETVAPVEAAPATEVAPASETPAAEEAKTETEKPAPVAEVEAEAPAAVEAAPASATVSEVTSTETVASETKEEVAEVTEAAAAPVAEPVVEEAVAPAAEPAAEAVAEAVAEPEAETTPATEELAAPEPTVSFTAAGTTTEQNVVFYQFTLVDKEDPSKETTIRKRFTDFKVLHAEVAKLMASESNVPASQGAKFATYPALPPLPKSGMTTVLFGRKNKSLTADREAQFATILNAIARHPIAFESDAVKSFLA